MIGLFCSNLNYVYRITLKQITRGVAGGGAGGGAMSASTAVTSVIRINAPQLSKFNATIQLDAQLTAGDVLARFSEPAAMPPLTPSSNGR